MTKKFLRRTYYRYSKLGKRRKKKQKWRRPTGRDNKMREKRRGYPKTVSIGYKKKRNEEQKILVKNLKDLEKVRKGEMVRLGKMGLKKKITIIQKIKELGAKIEKINLNKFLAKYKLKGEK